ncbi:unnamed protein product [Dibothriocephalus latus]|uniref:Uncharacterized protein n=1 Tax=Dibothriocephalus latus TaxID=60516 RepID=A0A3P7NDM1_DIBLA|nr:unnamed protein product [Dibothriocephalus latus]
MLYPCATESELVSHLVRFQQGEKVVIASASAKGKGTKKRRNGKPKQHLLPRELTLLWPAEVRWWGGGLACSSAGPFSDLSLLFVGGRLVAIGVALIGLLVYRPPFLTNKSCSGSFFVFSASILPTF